jgi:hypothetical protein
MAATGVIYLAIACHNQSGTDLAQKYARHAANSPGMGINEVIDLLGRIAGGGESARVYCAVDNGDGTAGTCTVTCTDANYTAGETLTVCGVVFTVAAAYSSDAGVARNQLVAGGSDALSGVSLKNKINEHPLLKDLVTATDNGAGVVTLTARDKGLFANLAIMAETGDAFAVTQVSNGAEGTLTKPLTAWAKGI